MKYCELTLPTPEQNLACDEAFLDLCESGEHGEVLRLWEPAQTFVVLGYGNRAAVEADLPYCRRNGIPVLRRCSGGGAVLQAPGCFNFSLLLPINRATSLQSIPGTNAYIMGRNRDILCARVGLPVETRGHTDLALGGRKFSGNSQRRRQRWVLFHGCFLLKVNLELVCRTLPPPSREPDYRAGRDHRDFLMNLEVPCDALKAALLEAWNATEPTAELPSQRIEDLVRERYGRPEWNLKF